MTVQNCVWGENVRLWKMIILGFVVLPAISSSNKASQLDGHIQYHQLIMCIVCSKLKRIWQRVGFVLL